MQSLAAAGLTLSMQQLGSLLQQSAGQASLAPATAAARQAARVGPGASLASGLLRSALAEQAEAAAASRAAAQAQRSHQEAAFAAYQSRLRAAAEAPVGALASPTSNWASILTAEAAAAIQAGIPLPAPGGAASVPAVTGQVAVLVPGGGHQEGSGGEQWLPGLHGESAAANHGSGLASGHGGALPASVRARSLSPTCTACVASVRAQLRARDSRSPARPGSTGRAPGSGVGPGHAHRSASSAPALQHAPPRWHPAIVQAAEASAMHGQPSDGASSYAPGGDAALLTASTRRGSDAVPQQQTRVDPAARRSPAGSAATARITPREAAAEARYVSRMGSAGGVAAELPASSAGTGATASGQRPWAAPGNTRRGTGFSPTRFLQPAEEDAGGGTSRVPAGAVYRRDPLLVQRPIPLGSASASRVPGSDGSCPVLPAAAPAYAVTATPFTRAAGPSAGSTFALHADPGLMQTVLAGWISSHNHSDDEQTTPPSEAVDAAVVVSQPVQKSAAIGGGTRAAMSVPLPYATASRAAYHFAKAVSAVTGHAVTADAASLTLASSPPPAAAPVAPVPERPLSLADVQMQLTSTEGTEDGQWAGHASHRASEVTESPHRNGSIGASAEELPPQVDASLTTPPTAAERYIVAAGPLRPASPPTAGSLARGRHANSPVAASRLREAPRGGAFSGAPATAALPARTAPLHQAVALAPAAGPVAAAAVSSGALSGRGPPLPRHRGSAAPEQPSPQRSPSADSQPQWSASEGEGEGAPSQFTPATAAVPQPSVASPQGGSTRPQPTSLPSPAPQQPAPAARLLPLPPPSQAAAAARTAPRLAAAVAATDVVASHNGAEGGGLRAAAPASFFAGASRLAVAPAPSRQVAVAASARARVDSILLDIEAAMARLGAGPGTAGAAVELAASVAGTAAATGTPLA